MMPFTRMSLGGHIVGLANKKESYNNNDVERRVASIEATLLPSGEKGKVSDNCEKDRCIKRQLICQQ